MTESWAGAMNSKKAKVLITFDSMRYPNTGFFYFGKSLAQALADENNGDLDITLYTHPSVSRDLLPRNVNLINKTLLHKVLFPYKFNLTHFSDQYCHPDPYLVRGKKILTIHDINPLFELEGNPAKQLRYIRRMQRYIRIFDHIVAISNYVAAQIIQYFPEAERKISVIYNGADRLPMAKVEYEPVYIPSVPFLFTIGILSPRKNFHVLPALLENNNLELIIAGIVKDDYKALILEQAMIYKCLDRVKIIGTINDTDKAFYYQNCEALVFPSIAEGFGLPVIEAMHFGKPVFLSRLSSLPEIGGDEAFYFDTFEGEKMQEVLRRGLEIYRNTPDKKKALEQRASMFSWNRAASKYLELYKAI